MEEMNITISRGLFAQLVEAQKEADMLKRLLLDKKYIGIAGSEIALLCKALGLDEEKE